MGEMSTLVGCFSIECRIWFDLKTKSSIQFNLSLWKSIYIYYIKAIYCQMPILFTYEVMIGIFEISQILLNTTWQNDDSGTFFLSIKWYRKSTIFLLSLLIYIDDRLHFFTWNTEYINIFKHSKHKNLHKNCAKTKIYITQHNLEMSLLLRI